MAKNIIKSWYFKFTGYSYTNLGRLFLRLFTGIMMIQFGVRELMHFYDQCDTFPAVLGMSPTCSLAVMIIIEIVCSLFIMCGFLTRFMIIPPLVSMIFAEIYLLHDFVSEAPFELSWLQPGYLPVMFIGIYLFMLLVGPGKISIDYFLSLHLIHSDELEEEQELEEV